jgi:hypothetical protein
MNSTAVIVKNREDIPSDWEVLKVRKKTPVRIRAAIVPEEFKVSWEKSVLTSDPAVDLIVIQPNGKEYPCKEKLFFETYQAHTLDTSMAVGMRVDTWIKKATTEIVRVPEGFDVAVITLEGEVKPVNYPDFIAIGSSGELYANSKAFVEENLLFV